MDLLCREEEEKYIPYTSQVPVFYDLQESAIIKKMVSESEAGKAFYSKVNIEDRRYL